jgi:hypothetical protein
MRRNFVVYLIPTPLNESRILAKNVSAVVGFLVVVVTAFFIRSMQTDDVTGAFR